MVELCLLFCLPLCDTQDNEIEHWRWVMMHMVTLSVGLSINNMMNLLFSR